MGLLSSLLSRRPAACIRVRRSHR
ncbi:hypothetical protein CSPAE12_11859 [Colletotrichum incanum]|nr:hypothetical protein CSPAE12_11859 [Colletotrichum incanum]